MGFELLWFLISLAVIKLVVHFVNRIITDTFLARKIIHILVGLIVCGLLYLFRDWTWLVLLGVAFVAINGWDIFRRNHVAMSNLEHNWGTIFFPLAFIFLILYWGYAFRELILTSFLIMVISDSLAGIVGRFRGGIPSVILCEPKTITGSFIFFIASGLIGALALVFLFALPFLPSLWLALMIALLLTLVEALSVGGIDNLTVPVFASFFYQTAIETPIIAGTRLFVGIMICFLIVYLAWRNRWLDLGGNIAAFFLGTTILFLTDWFWIFPLLFFFFSGSFLSQWKKDLKTELTHWQEVSGRNVFQVFANASIALLPAFFYNQTHELYWLYCYMAAIAAMTADTWASELGMVGKSSAYSILSFKPVAHGLSGAVSARGLLMAVAGGLIVPVFLRLVYPSVSWLVIVLIGFSAWLGQIVDSILGATIQARYICPVCNHPVEFSKHCHQQTSLSQGWRFINNHWVNFISSCAAMLIFAIFFHWFDLHVN